MATITQRVRELEQRTGGDPEPLVISYVEGWGRPDQRPAPDDPALDAMAAERGWRKIGPCTYEVPADGAR